MFENIDYYGLSLVLAHLVVDGKPPSYYVSCNKLVVCNDEWRVLASYPTKLLGSKLLTSNTLRLRGEPVESLDREENSPTQQPSHPWKSRGSPGRRRELPRKASELPCGSSLDYSFSRSALLISHCHPFMSAFFMARTLSNWFHIPAAAMVDRSRAGEFGSCGSGEEDGSLLEPGSVSFPVL